MPKRLRRTPPSVVGLLLLGPPLLGCKRDETTDRVAPWRATADETASARERAPFALSVSADSKLRFSLPAPKASPQGELAGLEGTVETDLFDLAQTRGTLAFPLERVRIHADDLGPDEGRTTEALRWLGLGSLSKTRERDRLARLEISSLRRVRPLRPAQGEILRDERGSDALGRRVHAEAIGHLVIRGLGVDVELPVTLDFFYRSLEGTPPTPTRVVARLDSPLRVPLVEHDIGPRDESGIGDASALPLLGTSVGKTALVEGTLELLPAVR